MLLNLHEIVERRSNCTPDTESHCLRAPVIQSPCAVTQRSLSVTATAIENRRHAKNGVIDSSRPATVYHYRFDIRVIITTTITCIIRPHRMRRTDAAYCCRRRTFRGLFVCLFGTCTGESCRMAEPIEIAYTCRDVHRRYLENTIKPSVGGGDASVYQTSDSAARHPSLYLALRSRPWLRMSQSYDLSHVDTTLMLFAAATVCSRTQSWQ